MSVCQNKTQYFYLLLRTANVPVSRVMQRLLTGYIVNYNRLSVFVQLGYFVKILQLYDRKEISLVPVE